MKPFETNKELIEHYQNKLNKEVCDNLIYPSLYKPVIWVKSKYEEECQYMITGYSINDWCQPGVWFSDRFITLEKLFEDFVFLDNSPCGKEE